MTVLAVAPIQAASYALAALLVPFGLWMLWGGRDFSERPLDDELHPPPPPRTRLHALRDSLTRPSRTAFGLAAIITAWHAIAWTHPALHMLQVPLERWWALVLGVLVALWSSLAMDKHFR